MQGACLPCTHPVRLSSAGCLHEPGGCVRCITHPARTARPSSGAWSKRGGASPGEGSTTNCIPPRGDSWSFPEAPAIGGRCTTCVPNADGWNLTAENKRPGRLACQGLFQSTDAPGEKLLGMTPTPRGSNGEIDPPYPRLKLPCCPVIAQETQNDSI